MDTRLVLHNILLGLMPDEDKNAYFQPPANVQMEYPCIVYAWNDENVEHADNVPYLRVKRWEITVIDRDPDSVIPGRIASLPMCRFASAFKVDNLNHTVYNLFFGTEGNPT